MSRQRTDDEWFMLFNYIGQRCERNKASKCGDVTRMQRAHLWYALLLKCDRAWSRTWSENKRRYMEAR